MTSPTARANQKKRAAMMRLPDDIKHDIADVVRSLQLVIDRPGTGGLCLWRALCGYYTLSGLGIDARIALGGMLYRVGPDEVRDTMAFAGRHGIGTVYNGIPLFHLFLKTSKIDGRGEIVDFAVGDWKHNDIPDGLADNLGPIQWTIEPPDFFWDDDAKLRRDSELTSPELGKVWYTGFDGDPSAIFRVVATMQDEFREIIMRSVFANLKMRNLFARVAAYGYEPIIKS